MNPELWRTRMRAPEWALLALVVAGTAVRGLACAALWPVATTLSDSATYAFDAAHNPLADPQHPPGYPILLAFVGLFTRSVAAITVLQHILGIATALLLFLAVRRIAGSPWPALVPAAVALLDGDEVFLEHNVMSEGPFLFLVTLALYAGVRAMDAPDRRWWQWPVLAAVAIAAAAVTRSAAIFAIPVLAIAMVVGRAPDARFRWRLGALCAGTAAVLLTGYSVANLASNGRLTPVPAPGWHLYARVAPFADCRRFTPPPGTGALCENDAPVQRSGPDFYLYTQRSPARRAFGRIGSRDAQVGAFALQAALHQPGALLDAFWIDARRYFVPSWHTHGWYKGWQIQPQLDWSREGGAAYTRNTIAGMTRFFTPFLPGRNRSLVAAMHDYQQVVGFGGTLLTICALLTPFGLCIGSRGRRAGVLLFGVGALAQLIAPTISVLYMGRYAVPLAPLAAAGAAIALSSAFEMVTRRRLRRPPQAAERVRRQEKMVAVGPTL